jgi:RNA polymerase sigma-70 factor (ECF subfamily)
MSPLALVPRLPVDSSQGPSDAELVAQIRAGMAGAEERLYRRYVGYVNALCVRLLGNHSEAEDAVQDTFVSVLQDLPKLRDPTRLKFWITRVAVHRAHRRFRRRRLLRALGLHDAAPGAELLVPAPGCGPEEVLELVKLSQLLAELPDLERAAWVLRHVDGHRLEEVAALCACSLATAKRRVARAQASLRHVIELEGPSDV